MEKHSLTFQLKKKFRKQTKAFNGGFAGELQSNEILCRKIVLK